MKPQNQRKTRRTVLAATGVAAAFGLAGCVSGDDGDGDGTEPDAGNGGTDPGEADGDERTVTLLVEGVGGHGDGDGGGEEHEHSETEGEHDYGEDGEGEYDDGQDGEKEHDHGHNETEGDHDGSEGHDYGDEGLTSEELGHACNHMTEVEEFGAEDVEAGASAEEAPHLSEVHHPYRVTYEAESGYVRFELATTPTARTANTATTGNVKTSTTAEQTNTTTTGRFSRFSHRAGSPASSKANSSTVKLTGSRAVTRSTGTSSSKRTAGAPWWNSLRASDNPDSVIISDRLFCAS
jgi:hypothetical protein